MEGYGPGQGTELVFVTGDSMMVVPVQTTPKFEADIPRKLFTGSQAGASQTLFTGFGISAYVPMYDVTEDGQRFVMVRPVGLEEETTPTITVVENWAKEVEGRE